MLCDQVSGEIYEDGALIVPDNYTRTALILPTDISYERWAEIGKTVQKAASASTWWVGDWWAYGEHRYGERAAQAVEAEHEYQTLANAAYVSSRFEFSRRRENLSWSHHSEVASLEPDEQDRLLTEAEHESWSTRDLRKAVRRSKSIGKGQRLLPSDKYRVLYADPPWEYGNAGLQEYGHASFHYPTMSIQQLCDLPIESLSADDAVLFMWVTSPLLEECFPVIKAWGFEYKTSFVWDKVKHNHGHYNSVRHELLLVCTRGSCTPDVPNLLDSVQVIERTEHSEKPEAFREIIDKLYTQGRRIELFARKKVPNWEAWGNEIAA